MPDCDLKVLNWIARQLSAYSLPCQSGRIRKYLICQIVPNTYLNNQVA